MTQGLEQVKQAIMQALTAAGANAAAAFSPGWAKQYTSPVVAVGFRTGESRSAAMGNYLGQQLDPATQLTREIYGAQLELTLSLDIYSPAAVGAAGCDETLPLLHQVMLEGLPAGLKPLELKWEETTWEEATGMFLRRGSLLCSAYFIAEVNDEGELLTDFILKGVMSK